MEALPRRLRNAFERGGEMGARMSDLDWAATPVGDPAGWPHELVDSVSTMLASRAQIIIFWGPEHVVLYNDAYTATMGTKHPGLLGRPGRELWGEIWDVLRGLFDGVIENDSSFHARDHLFMIERYGFAEETYFDVSFDPIRSDDGLPGGVMCIVTETTGRVLGERRVRTLSALGRRLADSPDQAALATETAAVLTADAEDVPFAALILDGDGGPHQAIRAVIAEGRPGVVPLAELAAPVPAAAAGEALILPIGAGADTVGALVVGVSRHLALDDDYRDFLDLAAAQVSRAVANVRETWAKSNFFADVSHEFRTPLTLILGPLEEMIEDPALRDRLMPVHRNALRLLKLVNTVLDFSRSESGRMRAVHRPTDLAGYTARLAQTFRPAVERAGLTLTLDLPALGRPVYVDHELWEKIVFNLLSNAVKFTREGGVEVRIRAVTGHAELTVRDTGAGIPESDQPMLFDRFHRVTGTWSRSREGTGIGLALVRELAELHGGSVGVTSRPGRGSVFTVRIPFGTGHLPADRLSDDPAPPGDPAEPRLWVDEATWWAGDGPGIPQPDPATRGGRILLADDNADLREYVARLLAPYWDVVTAVDGETALALTREQQFDLVLTDVMMPGLDGFDLIAALRAGPRTRDVPIVVLSARAGEEAAVEGLAAGADDYLAKPFSTRDLIARVRANLELGQLRREIVSRLRGLVDAAAALNAVPTTAEVLDVAARHIQAMTSAGRVVLTTPDGRSERDGGAVGSLPPDTVLALPDTTGPPLGELRVWSGPGGSADTVVLTQLARLVGLRLANARLYETEHRIASTLQHSLLPQSLPRVPGAIVAGRYLPGSSEARVGGDWYDVIAGPDGELFLVIGDVVGKGVQAAAGMGQLRNALRAYLLEGFDCGTALSRLNRLVDTLGRRQFATVLCVGFDPRTRRMSYSSAGHPSPVLIPAGQTGTFLYDTALGPPIGALGSVTYPTRETELDSGTRLLLYTDGLIEDRRQAIDDGLTELTVDVAKPTEHVDDMLDALMAKATRRGSRRDDIAMVALEVTEPREFELRLPSEAGRLIVLRRRLEDFLVAHQVPDEDSFDLIVAVSEAAANAIEHPVEPAVPWITVTASFQPDAVVVTIRDTGGWRPSTDPGFRGRGLALIGALTELSVHRSVTGTEVVLRRPISRS